jgi:hypothetical protein
VAPETAASQTLFCLIRRRKPMNMDEDNTWAKLVRARAEMMRPKALNQILEFATRS